MIDFFEPQPHIDAANNRAYFKERGWEADAMGYSFSLNSTKESVGQQRMIWYRTEQATAHPGPGWWEVTYFASRWQNLNRRFNTAQEAFVFAELQGWEW